VVEPGDIDSAAELANYDVVVWGDSGQDDMPWTVDMATAIDTWATTQGGGVVSTSWVPYALGDNEIDLAMDDLTPIDAAPADDDLYCNKPASGPLVLDVVATHPVVAGLTSISTTGDYVNYGAPEGSAPLVLAEVQTHDDCSTAEASYPAVVVDEPGDGRLVFVGLLYQASAGYNVGDVRTDDPDRLLEQAVHWAAGHRDTDEDSVLNEDDNCPFEANEDQKDTDDDTLGNACDDDDDDDGVQDEDDNCPLVENADQADEDDDGVGDACAPTAPPGEGGGGGESSAGGGAGGAAGGVLGGAGGDNGDGDDSAGNDGGCGCATVGHGPSSSGYGLLAAGLAWMWLRRRATRLGRSA
jgi:MYXO-CTERM domain-containing protein